MKGRDTMNIFQHKDSLIGSLDSTITNTLLMSLFQLAMQIRTLLGKQAYLLDCYLSIFFEGANSTLAYEAADKGFLKYSELQSIFSSFFKCTDKGKSHPLYKSAQELFFKQVNELPF